MSAALIAVSVGDSIVKFGAYAGYASIIGLGVLSLLYFAQAREVKRLREWAGRSPERDAELAQRVQTDAQRRVVAQPLSPATTAAQQAEAARTAAAAALYAKIPAPPPPPPPLVGQPGQLARPVAPGAVPGTAPAMPAAGATTTPAPGSVPGAMTPAPGSVPGAMTPAPGSVPGAMTPAPGSVPGATAITPGAAAAAAAASASRSTSVLGNGSGGQETHESDAARPDPAEAPFSRDSFSADDDEGGFGFSPGRTGAIIGGAVAAVLVAVVLMVALTRDNPPAKPNQLGVVTAPATSSPASGGSSATTTASSPAAVDRRATRVAVLNGTTQTGLARTVADEVEKARFTISATETNADQTVRTTTVSYGSGSQRAAQIIAQVLGIDGGSVQPVDPSASAAADADVVVIVGADKIG
jgi:hypothetical protein